jgi:hypothetical protein
MAYFVIDEIDGKIVGLYRCETATDAKTKHVEMWRELQSEGWRNSSHDGLPVLLRDEQRRILRVEKIRSSDEA